MLSVDLGSRAEALRQDLLAKRRERRVWIRPKGRGDALRVGLLLSSFNVGGVERWAIGLAKHAALEWVGCGVLSHIPVASECTRELSRLMPLYAPSDGQGVTRVASPEEAAARVVAGADVVIAWCKHLGHFLAGWDRGPIVLVSHGSCEYTGALIHDSVPAATHYVAVSELAVAPFPASVRDRVTVIPNGVEMDRLTPARPRDAVRREWGIGERLAVGYVGRFSSEKNSLAAGRAVRALGGDAVAVYVGRGWTEQIDAEFRQEAARVSPCVFAGVPQRVGDAYSALDCLVLASPSEGYGLVVVEAWAAGLPVVASATGIVPEAEREHGPLVVRVAHDATPECLAAAVRQAVDSTNRGVVERAKQAAWSRYSAMRMAAEWERWLGRLVATEARDNVPMGCDTAKFPLGRFV